MTLSSEQLQRIDQLIREGRISSKSHLSLCTKLAAGEYATVEEACDGENLWLLQNAANPRIVAEVVEENASLFSMDPTDETCVRYLTGQVQRRLKGTIDPNQARTQILEYLKTRK